MRAVNLLPREDASGGKKAPPLPVLVACVGSVLVFAVLAMMFLSANAKVAQQRKALTQVQAEYNAIPAPPPPSPVVKDLPQQRQTRVTALAGALGQRVVWDRLLREVSQVVPSDVWLVTLTAKSPMLSLAGPRAAVAAPGSVLPDGFIATGCTYSQDSVARFLARLQLVPDLGDMTLGKSSTNSSGSGDATVCPDGMFTFTLNGNVRVTSGAAS
jgi:Tfp pilus assembly protein PilN